MGSSHSPILVGRAEELQQLLEFVDRALSGNASVAFVTGEAGIGKTALVLDVLQRLRQENPALLTATGECKPESLSYFPFRSILADLLRADHGEIRSKDARTDGQTSLIKQAMLNVIHAVGHDVLEIFFPLAVVRSLEEELQSAPVPPLRQEVTLSKEFEPVQIFGWYAQIIKAIAQHFPLVLFLDDLHLADIPSLQLFLYLGKELKSHPVCLVGAFRLFTSTPDSLLTQIKHRIQQWHLMSNSSHSEESPEVLLAQIKAALQPDDIREYLLGGSQEHPIVPEKAIQFVAAYLMATYGTTFSERFVQLLAERTGGNPLFLCEILTLFEERGQIQTIELAEESLQWQLFPEIDRVEELPKNIEYAISEQVERLGKQRIEILEAASVQGNTFTAEILASVVQMAENDLMETLTGTLATSSPWVLTRGVRLFSDAAPGHEFGFRHQLIRDYFYKYLSIHKKVHLHGQIGKALEGVFKSKIDEIAPELAVHFYRAQLADKAVYYCLNAAEMANKRYGASAALRLSQLGLELLEKYIAEFSEQDAAEYRWRMLLELSKAEEACGEPRGTEHDLRRGIACLEDNLPILNVADDSLHAAIYAQLGKLYSYQEEQIQGARDYLEQALCIYEQKHDLANLFQVLYKLADVYAQIHDSEETQLVDHDLEILEKCLALAEQLQDTDLQSRCSSRLTLKYIERDFPRAEQYAQQVLRLSQLPERTDSYLNIKALNAMAAVCREDGRFQTGIRYLEEALDLVKCLGDVFLEAAILNDLGFDYGRYVTRQEQSQEALERSLSIRERLGLNTSAPLCNLGWLYTRQGKWQAAEICFRQSIVGASPENQASYRGNIGRLYELQENYTQAELELLYKLEILEKYKRAPNLFGYTGITLSYALAGDEARARRYMEVAQTLFEHETRPRRKWWCLYEIADGHRILGEFDAAQIACQQAIAWFLDQAENAEDVIYLAEARLIMGKILVDTKAYQDAQPFLEQAGAAFERCQHYALGETWLYLGKAYHGLNQIEPARAYVTKAFGEFQRLELPQKTLEAQELLRSFA